jgi:hypothetical protein
VRALIALRFDFGCCSLRNFRVSCFGVRTLINTSSFPAMDGNLEQIASLVNAGKLESGL